MGGAIRSTQPAGNGSVAGNQLILCLNFGSSSLRFALFEQRPAQAPRALCRGHFQGIGSDAASVSLDSDDWPPLAAEQLQHHASAVQALTRWLQETGLLDRVSAVAHRIVHGGTLPSPQRLDDTVLQTLERLSALAPLHQPVALAGVETCRRLLPDSVQLACFDTAFHLTMPEAASRYALPALDALPVPPRRAGFHGLSYDYVSRVMQQQVPTARRLVIAHLGSGASLCAVADGRSRDTTMGLTPLDGVPMATRSGSVDPGLLLWLQTHAGLEPAALSDLLYRRSGWAGLSGLGSDMRTLLDSAATEPAARLAIDVFTYQCARAIAGLCVALRGLDGLVFTGGIGERSAAIRAEILAHCSWLGLTLDLSANQAADSTAEPCAIATEDSAVAIWVVPTDEEQTMAEQAARLLAETPDAGR